MAAIETSKTPREGFAGEIVILWVPAWTVRIVPANRCPSGRTDLALDGPSPVSLVEGEDDGNHRNEDRCPHVRIIRAGRTDKSGASAAHKRARRLG